jgi:hypothetical protein
VTNPSAELLKVLQRSAGDALDGEDRVRLLNFLYPMPEALRHIHVGRRTLPDNGDKVPHGTRYTEGMPPGHSHYTHWFSDDEGAWCDEAALERLNREHGTCSWYRWSINNWGTKWDATDPRILEEGGDYIVVSFDTAWGPPSDAINNHLRTAQIAAGTRFELDYLEPGMGFGGRICWEGTEIESDLYCSYQEYGNLDGLRSISPWHAEWLANVEQGEE